MKKKKKLIISLALALALTIGVTSVGFYMHSLAVKATFDPNECITFGTYAAKTDIPSATLWVGTYLMSMPAVDDDLLDKAKESAEASGQGEWYYKSELTDGYWYQVTNASSLTDITSTDTTIDESALSSLYVKYYVDANGNIYDLYSEEADINPYNSPDPYDKWYMSEYSDVANLVNSGHLSENSSDATLQFYYSIVIEHMDYQNTDDYTDEKDQQLSNIWTLKNALEATGDEDDANYAEALDDVLESLDADRKHHYIDNILNEDGVTAMPEFKSQAESPWTVSSLKATDSESVTAVDNADSNLQNSLDSLSEEIISDPGESGSLIDQEKYKCYAEIIAYDSSAGVTDDIRSTIKRFLCCENLENDDIVYQSDELALAEELLPQAISIYEGKLSAGITPQYATAVSQGSESSGLTAILEEQQSETTTAQYAVRTLIDAKKLRIEDADAVIFVADKLVEANDMYSIIVQGDEFTDAANVNLANYIDWLSDLMDSLLASAEAEGTTGDDADLETQISNYESQLEEANLNNDQATAENLQLLIDELTSQLSDSTSGSSSTSTSGSTTTAENAATAVENAKSSITSSALSEINAGSSTSGSVISLVVMEDEEDLSSLLSQTGLGSMLNSLAYASDISDAAKGNSSSSDSSDSSSEFLTSVLNDNMSDSDKTNLSNLASTLGTDVDSLTDADKLAILTAADNGDSLSDSSSGSDSSDSSDTSDSSDSGDSSGTSDKGATKYNVTVSDDLKDQLLLELRGSGLLYDAYSKNGQIYVSLKALSNAVGGRYVFDLENQEVDLEMTIDGKVSTYIFTAGSETAKKMRVTTDQKNSTKSVIMDDEAVQAFNTIYISQKTASSLYSVTGVWIDSDYMAALNSEAYEKYQELIKTE